MQHFNEYQKKPHHQKTTNPKTNKKPPQPPPVVSQLSNEKIKKKICYPVIGIGKKGSSFFPEHCTSLMTEICGNLVTSGQTMGSFLFAFYFKFFRISVHDEQSA